MGVLTPKENEAPLGPKTTGENNDEEVSFPSESGRGLRERHELSVGSGAEPQPKTVLL